MDRGTRVVDLYARATERFAAAVAAVPAGGWSAATPCEDWDVRALTNHLVGEDRWVPPLVEGRTIAEVGDALDGDLLGTDPAQAASSAGKAAVAALAEPGALGRTVHLSFGDFSAEEYGWQVLVDHVVHTWDLLAGSGQDRTLDGDLVDAASAGSPARRSPSRASPTSAMVRPSTSGGTHRSSPTTWLVSARTSQSTHGVAADQPPAGTAATAAANRSAALL